MTRLAAMAALLLLATPAAGAPSGNGRLAFAAGGIHAANAEGSGRTNLTPTFSTALHPIWSPSGTQIAFLVVDPDELDDYQPAGDLWVVNGDGTGLRRLAVPRARGHSWSPDGARIAFLGSPAGEVYVVRVADGAVRRLTSDGGSKSPPSWSQDGMKLVYGRYRSTISVIDSGDGRLVRELPIASTWNPVWSPDGTRIAFFRVAPWPLYTIGDLNVVAPDGTGQRTISGDFVNPSAPAWTSDGTRLLVTAAGGLWQSGSVSAPLDDEVYMVTADGSRTATLTRGRGGSSAVWSPDETKIGFTSKRAGRRQIFVANADGTCPTQLTGLSSPSQEAYAPSWQAVPGGPGSPLLRCADLVLAAASRSPTLPWGSTSELRFTLTNEGNEPATSVRLVMRLPLTLVARMPPGGGCAVERRRIACELPGALVSSTTFGLFVQPVRTGAGTVTITAEAREPDSDRSSNLLRLVLRVSACTRLGSHRADVLVGTSRADVLCGYAGSDRLIGRGGADRLLGGPNGDTIVDGPGRDRLSGGPGADVIVSDDGEIDSLDCGRGPDRVVADRADRVSRDCERVIRR